MDGPRTEVYVTSHGHHYHRPGQHHYTGSGKAFTSLGRAAAYGYAPCTRCFRRVKVGREPTPQYLAIIKQKRS